MMPRRLTLGAIPGGSGRCAFRVWAPKAQTVEVCLVAPTRRIVPMEKNGHGYHVAVADDVPPGSDYVYRLDGRAERPDPCSRWQPRGVHGPSRVADTVFEWTDGSWFGPPLRDYILYELHVGAFSEEGTFDGVAAHLPELKALGVSAIELMPVAQFPGARNWGYDGVFPFAVQDSYGGPAGLKRLVNAAHAHGLAVVLDVVYNHLGPEGNCLGEFAPYFTNRYQTPWGSALNFDGPHSDEVRRYFIENALYWQTEFHIDALRLDAVHAIRDFSAVPFLEDLAQACHRQSEALNRRFHVIAESDLNMARHCLPRALGGCGLDAQWSDDFHHCLHVLLTGERSGYYADFGGVRLLAKVFREGYAYTGEHSAFRGHRHGSDPRDLGVKQFVVCAQNHDQTGNRMLGERLGVLVDFESQKLAAASVLLSPFIPLLFMGQEYGETAPFQYFVSHGDPALIDAVRKGRHEEFAAFAWRGEVPDPQDEQTFLRSKLDRRLLKDGRHRQLRAFHAELIRLRKTLEPLGHAEKGTTDVVEFEQKDALAICYRNEAGEVALLLNFSEHESEVTLTLAGKRWEVLLNSAAPQWGGPGPGRPADFTTDGSLASTLPARSAVVLRKL